MKHKRKLSFLLVFTMIMSLFWGAGPVLKAKAAKPTWFEAYPMASYEMRSPYFELRVGGESVDVVHYYEKKSANHNGYSYAHLAYEGITTFEVTCLKGAIEAVDASPHSYNMDVKISGNSFTFDLAQAKSRYMVFDVRAAGESYQLIVAADSNLNLKAPEVDGVKVVSAKEGMKSIGVGGLSSSDNAAQGKSNTDKIQKIISELSRTGGGTLYFPEGVYSFVTINATSNVTLYLDAGAVLRGSGIRTDYDWNSTGANGIQAKQRDIRIKNVKNFKIIGKGMIDANSIVVSAKGKTASGSRELNNNPQPSDWYPDGWNDYRKGIVDGENSDGVEFKGVTFKDATGWTFNIRSTKNIEMNNVKMLDDYTVVHSDGYDIVSCQNVNVKNCLAVCGDDGFCPKGDISNSTMENYLFQDCVAYAEGGAGCKVGVQARSNVSNIVFDNIDVIRGYRGFSIAHDEGEGKWDGIYFRNIRTEKLYIPSFTTSSADKYGQYTATPFTLWLLSNGSVKNVEVTNCSFESISNMRAMIKGKSSNGIISNVKFNNLTMEGRTVTSLDDKRLSVGSNVDRDSFEFNNTAVYAPKTDVYEAEKAVLGGGAKTSKASNPVERFSGGEKVGSLGLTNGKEGTATFTVNVDQVGEYDMEIYGITKLARAFYLTVNNGSPKMVNCNGDGWTLQGRTTTKVSLKAGDNTVKLGNPSAAAPDLDKIEIVRNGGLYNPNAGTTGSSVAVDQPISLTVERELLALASGAKINNSGLIGNIGGAGNGTVSFHVQASKDAKHILRIYYATKEDRNMSVAVNNSAPDNVTCANNGSWDKTAPNPKELAISLRAGDNTVVIGGVDGKDAPNIDRIEVSLSDEEAQATVSAWIDTIPANVTEADRVRINAVKKAYDSLSRRDKISNASKLEAALEALEGRSFFTVLAETGKTAGSAEIIQNPKDEKDYYIGNLGGPNHGTVTFYVQAEQAGERTLKIYYSTMETREMNITVNDGVSDTLKLVQTGSWDEPGAVPLTVTVNLKAGDNVITFSGNGNGWTPNIDRIEISLSDQEIKDTVSAVIASLPDTDSITSDGGKADVQLKRRVDAVNNLYNSLPDKNGVNTDKLTEAQKALDGNAAVEEVIAAIRSIGTVTLKSGTTIQNAREKYNALADNQKSLVTNYQDLEDAEAAYKKLNDDYENGKEEDKDQIVANVVIESIKSISELKDISLEDGDKIQSARKAYEELTDAQKELVTNYKDLEKAEEIYGKLYQEAADKEEADKSAANEVMEMISSIGTVTLDSEEAILKARVKYEELTDAQKELVTNYSVLEVAEESLRKWKEEADADQDKQDSDDKENGQAGKDKEAADVVVSAIFNLGEITLGSKEKISAAREAYNALTENQKNYVVNYEYLVEAENQYDNLKEEADLAAVAVDKLILGIGEVTLESKDSIAAARAGYDALTKDEQALVQNAQILFEAEEKLKQLEGQKPGQSQEPIQSQKPAQSQEPGQGTEGNGNNGTVTKKPKAGDILTEPKTKEKYKILSVSGNAGTAEYLSPKNKQVNKVSIPNTVKIGGINYKVIRIAKNAFKNYKKLTNAAIGNNIQIIGNSAFQGCKKLRKVTIGKNVKKIGKKAFYGDKKLADITIKSAKLKAGKVGAKAFAKTSQKAKVKLKVPKSKLKVYKTWLVKKGISRKASISKK